MSNVLRRTQSSPAALEAHTGTPALSPHAASDSSVSSQSADRGAPAGLRPRAERGGASENAPLATRQNASAIDRLRGASQHSSVASSSSGRSEAGSGYSAYVDSFRCDSSRSSLSGYETDVSDNLVDERQDLLAHQQGFHHVYVDHARQAAADALPHSDTDDDASGAIAAHR
jgi:hypothetical protein